MIGQVVGQARPPIAAAHLRKDAWWALPLTVVVVLTTFVVYSTWAALQNAHYYVAPYLSPFYSPCLSKSCLHLTLPWGLPAFTFPTIGVVSPALLILWGPALFRLTCYYYRKAYYRSFWLAPVACAVKDVKAGYTFSCHSCRHVCGGHVDVFSKAPRRYTLWHVVSRLNEHHPTFAWLSLVFVGVTDLYIRLVSMGVIRDLRIL